MKRTAFLLPFLLVSCSVESSPDFVRTSDNSQFDSSLVFNSSSMSSSHETKEVSSSSSLASSSSQSERAVSNSTSTSSSISISSEKQKTPEEKLYEYIGRSGGSVLIARTTVEQSIQVDCKLASSLVITGSGSENKRITQTYSVSVEYTFTWGLNSGSYMCSRHYHSSNWQTNEQIDETTLVTAYIDYKIGGSVRVQRYSVSGATRWENTVKTAMDSIAYDCARQISRFA